MRKIYSLVEPSQPKLSLFGGSFRRSGPEAAKGAQPSHSEEIDARQACLNRLNPVQELINAVPCALDSFLFSANQVLQAVCGVPI